MSGSGGDHASEGVSTDAATSEQAMSKQPWYAAGVRFRCTACGVCCTGEPGYVWITRDEIVGMARAKGLSVAVFARRFVRRAKGSLSLVERENGDCALLEEGRCSVYAAKPARCTTFPFWPDIMDAATSWNETATTCEGVGQGDLYTREEIDALLAGTASIMTSKHARAPEQPVTSRFPHTGYPPPGAPVGRGELEGNHALPNPSVDAHPTVDWTAALSDLVALYEQLDTELPLWEFTCSASGRCCDFDAHGHRLYVTTLEVINFYRDALFETGGAPVVHQDPSFCPAWRTDRLCHARVGRMLGCRTYFCGPYPRGVPEDLHGGYHDRIRELHSRYRIPYAYADIRAWAERMATG